MAELGQAAGSASEPPRSPWQRRGAWLLLALVMLAHLLGANQLMVDRFGWGAGEQAVSRIEVAFVRELAQTAPPEAPAARAVAQGPPRLAAVASAPARANPTAPPTTPPTTPPAPPPEPEPPTAAPVVVDLAPAVAPSTSAAPPALPAPPSAAVVAQTDTALAVPTPAVNSAAVPAPVIPAEPVQAFDWPPSTRMTYLMQGNYRGPIQGRAQVDWLRSGTRYQVHLETSVAPLLSRRITSEGELTERGLAPRRFEGEQKVILRPPRRWSLQFGPERITLADGREVDTVPGAQDEASQFVQLTWLFTTQPQLLKVGQSIEVPLALNRRFDRWIYDVVEVQQLQLPFGSVETYHVKPRREAKGGDMTAEIWFAPSLQYLPVRILIRQDESTYIDLTLDKPPLQAVR